MTPTVVLLHGLARTHRSLSGLERFIAGLGYKTWSRSYPSRRGSIEGLAAEVSARLKVELGDRPILGVTHSLGGILCRHMSHGLNWQGLVMLAPPNQGSQVAARMGANPLFRWFYGAAAAELGASARAPAWPPPPARFAVIAGTSGPSLGNAPSWLIGAMGLLPPGEPHDGTVTVAETRLAGMVDFAEVPSSHTWLMNHPRARELVRRFLAAGDFAEPGKTTGPARSP